MYHRKHRDLIRGLILSRDNFSCRLCGFRSIKNHIHHIDYNKANNAPCNLITLCPAHHTQCSYNGLQFDFTLLIPKGAFVDFIHTQIAYVIRSYKP